MSRDVFPDPDIRHGPFRVLPQTDGGYVIEDTRRAPGERVIRDKKGEVMKWGKAKDAGAVARRWDAMSYGGPRQSGVATSTGAGSRGKS